MSRIGNAPIIIPSGVEVSINGQIVTVVGPKGTLNLSVDPAIKVTVEGGKVNLKRKNDQKRNRALHGLVRSLIANMILGVTNLWSKNLELVGVGFRAQANGNEQSSSSNKLVLNVGYSHPVEITAPENISFEVSDNTKIKVSGLDKALVGQVAANIKKVRVPDVYKGKGIRYEGEYIRKKAGKSAKAGVAGAGGAK